MHVYVVRYLRDLIQFFFNGFCFVYCVFTFSSFLRVPLVHGKSINVGKYWFVSSEPNTEMGNTL